MLKREEEDGGDTGCDQGDNDGRGWSKLLMRDLYMVGVESEQLVALRALIGGTG